MNPRPANSELFPRPPTLMLAEPLPLLRATLWADGEWRAHGLQPLVARCGDLVARGHRAVGDLCVLLDDAGHGACAAARRVVGPPAGGDGAQRGAGGGGCAAGVGAVSGADDLTAWGPDGLPLAEPVLRKRVKRKPGTAPKPSEDGLHITIKKALVYGLASPGFPSRHGVVWFSQENRNTGGKMKLRNGRMFSPEGAKRKMRGVIAGVPDMQFIWRGRSYWIELKLGANGTSDAQDRVHESLRVAGCEVAVAYGLGDVIAALTRWGIPHALTAA